MKRPLTLHLSKFSFEALAGDEGQGSEQENAARLVRAFRLYLEDRDSNQPGWAYPRFLRGEETAGLELELVVEEDLLCALEEEAGRQGVSVSQMAGHAAFYYAAELNAGRLTQRILNELENDGEGEDA
jgi:hypothetical protein